MGKLSGRIAALLLVFGSIVLAQSDSEAIGKAEAILQNLQDGKFAEIVAQFDPTMAKAIPEERLRSVWQGLTEQFGPVKRIDERRSGELKGYRAIELIVTFDREQLVQRMVLDGEGRIAGLAYQPASMAALPPAR
jgi:uncharacterized protein